MPADFWIGLAVGVVLGAAAVAMVNVLAHETSARRMPEDWRRETWRQHDQ